MPSLLGLNFHKKKSTDNLKGLSPLHSINREDSNHSASNNNNNAVQHHVHYAGADSVSPSHHQQQHHHNRSFNELTRFFRSSMRKKSTTSSQMNLTRSAEHHSHTQSAIPPSSDSTLSLANKASIYHDDSILAQKYGKLGKVLGSGAGGSVKVLVRPSDGRTFAVKQFRQRRPGESVKDYARKCTSEYMIGSMLHHPNVIETLDVFSDSKQNQYYEVMEYCPVDFFSVVMSGQMSRGEINCCFKQLVEGVNYLHTKGYAHRDLKLDNCVMTRDGILKLIDFGSAFVFKYTYEADEKLAHGIVGSDPYLAPEVLTSTKSYSAPLVDVWSIAIIFCCMMLKRFPWKEPRLTDNNFKVYCMTDDQDHDYEKSARDHELLMQKRREERLREKAAKLEIENKLPTPPTDGSTKHSPNELLSGATEEPGLNSPDINAITIKDDLKTAGQHHNQSPEQNALPKEAVGQHHNQSPEQTSLPKEAAGPASHIETNSGSTLNGNAVTVQKKQKRVIRGPYILLRLLPHASRPIMARMLQVDPAKRARMQDVLNDSWYKSIPSCTMDEHKNIIRAPNHSHTIVSEENTHVETYKV